MSKLRIGSDVVKSVRLTLKDFSVEPGLVDGLVGTEWSHQYEVPRAELPVPELVYLVLVTVLGLSKFGPFEKIRWVIPFAFKGMPCTIAFQKFGMYLYICKDAGDEASCEQHAREMLGKISRASRVLERKALAPFAKIQTQSGNVVITNCYYRFQPMYMYFRNKACEALRPRVERPKVEGIADLSRSLNATGYLPWEGFYNTVAMIDAYFSLLEHLFVMMLGWSDYRPESDDLLEYIGAGWSDKCQRLFHIHRDKESKDFYDRLRSVKEHYRNTFAHGGFEKGGASLRFVVPGVGAVPVQLSGAGRSPVSRFMPVEGDDFTTICQLFDEFDGWLGKGRYRYAIWYTQTSFNLPTDKRSRAEHRRASRSEEAFRTWEDRIVGLAHTHMNMDY